MAHIFTEQHHVVEQFTTHLQNLHEKESAKETTDEKLLDVMIEIKKLLEGLPVKQVAPSLNGVATTNRDFAHTATTSATDLIPVASKLATQDTAVQHKATSSQEGMAAVPIEDGAATRNEPSLVNGIPAATDASNQTTDPVAEMSVPETTVQFAKDVGREILNRRSELQKLEESTSYVSQQVGSSPQILTILKY